MFFLVPIIGTLFSGVTAAGAAVAGTAAAVGTTVAGTVAAGAATAAGVATSTTGLAVLGGAATYGVSKVIHDSEIDDARREGYQNGLRQGNLETQKKFEQRFKEFLEKSDANKIATWALGVHVANLDGIEDEELAVIYKKIGDPNSNLVSPYLRNQYMAIYEKCPRFGEIRAKYLNMVETEFLVELNEYVNQIILSDQVISTEEKEFLEYEWYPYLQSRGIGVGTPSQSASSGSASSGTSYSEYDAMDEWQHQQKAAITEDSGEAEFYRLIHDNVDQRVLMAEATHGDDEAMYKLGLLTEFGGGWEPQKEACKWYERAARHGHAKSQYRLRVLKDYRS